MCATSYTLYRATAAPGDPEPPRPETPWMSEMEQPSAADTDLIVGNKYIYWLCGVKDNVEGNFANAYMEWNE